MAVIPDPVTCFAAARYHQKQVFKIEPDSNLVVVDWFTSGRHENGEKWNFEVYKSTNHIFLNDEQPLFLDSVLLDQTLAVGGIAESMCNYQVIGMLIFFGPKLKCIQSLVQDKVKKMMTAYYLTPARAKISPSLIASCNAFGLKVCNNLCNFEIILMWRFYR